uniref:UDP-glucuronosyltransferase n=1 Tax=Lepisosteus oculatus TaxID=7918 RepID=W5NNJ4_LEPOC
MAQNAFSLFICCCFCTVFILNNRPVDAGKILVVPVDGSHWNVVKVLIMELVGRRHEVTVLRSSNAMYAEDKSPDFQIITVELPGQKARTMEEREKTALSWILHNAFNKESQSLSAFWDLFISIRRVSQDYKIAIETVFENHTLLKQLKDASFDLVLADPFYPGGLMIARHLKLPIVLFGRWMPTEDIHFTIAPSPLSYIPVLHSRLTDRMTFFERLKNVLMYSFGNFLNHIFIYSTYNALCQRYLETDESIYELYKKADIYLMKVDFAFEFMRPIMPNSIYIGGFQCRSPKPLPPDLQAFMDNAGEDGIVVFSLGTIIKTLPENVATEIASGLAQVPQKVIWRYTGPPISTLGNNTKVLRWLPQNDLLSHPNTKAFIGHGGENGIYEAIYHGVPVIGFPLFADNYENLLRLKVKGAAIILENLNRLTRHDIYKAVRTITEDPSYWTNMKKLSQVHRDTPVSPKELAVFWIEYVMRYKGASHLRAAGHDLAFYQYYMLDVITFLLIGSVLFFFVFWILLQLLCRKCLGITKTKQE